MTASTWLEREAGSTTWDPRCDGCPADVSTCVASWRRLTPWLWVGRVDDFPIGEIERGRRFVAIGNDGVVRGRYRTLAEAKRALECDPMPGRLGSIAVR